ncbi:ArpU family transcriptional regulator [Bacillus sp. A116_S68]|jgi:ArpU family phage transcriptional regulator|nr:ArpU family transcriptional regulator [Bacillus sp. A116_S68]
MKAINFQLPQINRKATRQAVEAKLGKLQMALLRLSTSHEPKITSSLELVPIKPSNQFHSSTEEAAIKNVEAEHETLIYAQSLLNIINKLPEMERHILIKEYFDHSYSYNYEIYNDLGISERQYYKLKGRAFYKMAFMLKIEVYANPEKVKA